MSNAAEVESLLFAALAKPTAAERAAFLGSACGGDAELRRQVERLLQAHADVGDFLQKPVVEQLAAAQPAHESNVTTDHGDGSASSDGSHRTGDNLGGDLPTVPGYRVLGEIARGGMGRVLAAPDHSLDRDVALKILLPGANAERFVRESKITARLPHPGIPPVHALGTLADSSPFLAMKLIAGQTLAEEMKTDERPRLLQAFVQVCQAVGFAHSRGIVHRDLKPANVMVGAFGEVQVMDWGLAKDLTSHDVPAEPPSSQLLTVPSDGADANQTTDHHWPGEATDDQTQAGQVMGTPAYMPPEQAKGEASDARSDVFALGGILCAILTGQPPFTGKSSLEVIQRARAADLSEAFARLDGCRADAELIALCRSCLSASPAQRPADGQAVADALTAHLGSVQERLQAAQRERAVALAREAEQRKRRKVHLALAAALVALLLGTGGFAFWRNQQAQVGRERDARNAEAVAALLGQAEQALHDGDAAKAAVALDAAKKRSDEGGAENETERLARLDADLALLRDLNEIDQFRWTWSEYRFADPAVVARRAREALARFGFDLDAVSVDEAAARVSTSVVRQRIVSTLDRLLLQEKKASVRALLGRVDANPYRDAVRDAILAKDVAKFVGLVGKEQALEQPPGFVAFLGGIKGIAVQRRRQLLQAAVGRRPGNLDLLMTLGETYPYREKESADEQLRWFQAAVAAAPDNFAAHINLGYVLSHKGDYDGAIACDRKAIELKPKDAFAHNNLGVALNDKGKVDEAIACYQKAIELDPKYAKAHSNLGSALAGKGQVDEAIACFKKAIALDPKYAAAHTNLGRALAGKGPVDEAIACYQKAIELDPKDAKAHHDLGLALHSKGQVEEAMACYQKAIELDPKFAKAHNNLGVALHDKGKVDEAIACFHKAIELDPKDAVAHTGLGAALVGKGRLDEAIACYKKAIELDRKDAKAHAYLGVALARKGRLDEAIACYKKAIKLDPKYATAHHDLGLALHSKGQVEEAMACFKKTIELDPKIAKAHNNLGSALLSKGQLDAAIASYRTAIELDSKDAMAHDGLGNALLRKGKVEEAVACFHKAIALDPKDAAAHTNLGLALADKGQLDEAIACWRKAIALDPKGAFDHSAIAHTNLGNALAQQGRFAESLAALRRGHELGSKRPGWRYPSAQWVRAAERMAALEGKLPAFLRGEFQPTDKERLALAGVCQAKKLHHAATRLYAAAFAADPRLAANLQASLRYNAACSAALAAAGRGEDAATLREKDRLELRRRALTWLRADLAVLSRQLQNWWPGAATQARTTLAHWQKDPDLAGLRDAAALAKLPAEERMACERLWTDVAALLKKAQTPAPKDGKP